MALFGFNGDILFVLKRLIETIKLGHLDFSLKLTPFFYVGQMSHLIIYTQEEKYRIIETTYNSNIIPVIIDTEGFRLLIFIGPTFLILPISIISNSLYYGAGSSSH